MALHITQRWDQLWLPIFSFARLRHNAARRICTHCRGRRMCWGSTCWECEDKISLKTSRNLARWRLFPVSKDMCILCFPCTMLVDYLCGPRNMPRQAAKVQFQHRLWELTLQGAPSEDDAGSFFARLKRRDIDQRVGRSTFDQYLLEKIFDFLPLDGWTKVETSVGSVSPG